MLSASGKEINLWDVAKESITYSYACEKGTIVLQQLMKADCVAVRWSPNFERVLVIHGEYAELLDMRVTEHWLLSFLQHRTGGHHLKRAVKRNCSLVTSLMYLLRVLSKIPGLDGFSWRGGEESNAL